MSTLPLDDVVAQIDAIGKASSEDGGQYLTNLFIPLSLLQERITSRRTEALLLPHQALLLLERLPNGKRQLSFVASSPAMLARALNHFKDVWFGDTICNFVGERKRLAEQITLFKEAGFVHYDCLRRMTRMPQKLPSPTSITAPIMIRTAQAGDCGAIRSVLEAVFDPWSEPVPTQEAMEAAISAGEILLACADGSLCGWDALLWAERKGKVNTVRFWLRHPDSRSTGAAGALMRVLLEEDEKITRLWVMEGNQNGIDRYRHYGFEFDPIETVITISRRDPVFNTLPI